MWWDGNRKMSKENFDNLLADFQAHAKGKKLFAQDLYGGADPKYRIRTRVFTEYAWHSLFIRQLLIRPERAELAKFVPELTIVDLPSFKPRRQAARRPRRLRHHGGDRFHPQDRADLRLVLRRRDEEVGVHHAQLLSAGARTSCRCTARPMSARTAIGAVLRPVRHRQDHAVGRSASHADRRRRARLGPGRHLQFRGRLLRQVHQALARGRAADLGRHQPLRRRAGERRVRSGNAPMPISTTSSRPRTRARPIRSTSFRMPRAPAAPGIRRTSSS